MDDATLIAEIAGGKDKAAAITTFHARWFHQFFCLAMKLTKDSHTAEDIAQEAIVRVIVNAGTFENGRSARSWLLSIVYHLVQDWGRRKTVRKAASLNEPYDRDENGPQALEIPDREPTPEERSLAHERQVAVRAALAKLSEDDRRVIVLRDYEALNGTETARILGITVEKVGSRLFRARKRLAAILQTDWPGLFPPHEL